MEISSLSAYPMIDNYRMSSAAAQAEFSAVHNSQDFAEILKRAVSSQNDGYENTSGLSKTKIDKEDQLYQLCLEFETFLVKNLLNSMRKTVQKSGLVDSGFAGEMYEDMLYDEYAKDFTKNAGFGLAEQAYRQLKRL